MGKNLVSKIGYNERTHVDLTKTINQNKEGIRIWEKLNMNG
jgi:hypothetical protein